MSAPASSALSQEAIKAVTEASKVRMDAWDKAYKQAFPAPATDYKLSDNATPLGGGAIKMTMEASPEYTAWHGPYHKAFQAEKWKPEGELYKWQRQAYLEATSRMWKGRTLCTEGRNAIADVEAMCEFRAGDKVVYMYTTCTVQDRIIDWDEPVKVVAYDISPANEPDRIISGVFESNLERYVDPDAEVIKQAKDTVNKVDAALARIRATDTDLRNPAWRARLAVVLESIESLQAISEPCKPNCACHSPGSVFASLLGARV